MIDHLDTHPQCERIPERNPLDELRENANKRVSNNAANTLLGYIQKLEAEYGPLVKPMPWYKRLYHRWVYKLKAIVKVIKE